MQHLQIFTYHVIWREGVMTRIFMNGQEISKEELNNYEIVMDATSKRVISFRKRKYEHMISSEKKEIPEMPLDS